MRRIGVVGDNGAVADELKFLSHSLGGGLIVETNPQRECYDVLLLHDRPRGLTELSLNCNAIVMNSDENILSELLPNLLRNAIPQLVLTYGFNSKASITASSVYEGTCCICVQREFTTTSGIHRERQELTVMTRDPGVTLAAVSALLAADIDASGIETLSMLVPRS